MQVQSLGQEDPPGEGNGNPFQYSCLQNPTARLPGQRSLMGYSPKGRKESDMTEASKCTHTIRNPGFQ